MFAVGADPKLYNEDPRITESSCLSGGGVEYLHLRPASFLFYILLYVVQNFSSVLSNQIIVNARKYYLVTSVNTIKILLNQGSFGIQLIV